MLTLLAVGFVAGVVTAFSPCILPVLPVIFAGGTTGSTRRSVAIVVGLAASFAAATLFGIAVLSALHLPEDLLTDVGIALLALLALGLLIDPIGELLERPFAKLSVAPKVGAGTSSGIVLGLGLGLVFVPCAGPILAAITAAAATRHVTWSAVALTCAYALGVALPLLAFALLSQRLATRWSSIRNHARTVRHVAGALIGAMAIVIATGAASSLQTAVPSYASSIEQDVVTPSVQNQLQRIDGEHANKFQAAQGKDASNLPDEGVAPNFTGISAWLNTPGDKPLSLAQLRGKVVLVDFWTYSCINCRRSLPHVEAWYRAYHRDGLVVVGVHTPEFAFEHVVSNVSSAAKSLGVTYPVAIDNDYGTWDAYNNEYWPAEYLIDQHGNVRHEDFGEGAYSTMERDIRSLLVAGGATALPVATDVPNLTPTNELTPESYLGYERLDNATEGVADNTMTPYSMPSQLPLDELAFGGSWNVHSWDATAGSNATLAINFQASDVYLVLGGTGTVTVSYNGGAPTTIHVAGYPNLYTLFHHGAPTSGVLTMTMTPGVRAYDFTFG